MIQGKPSSIVYLIALLFLAVACTGCGTTKNVNLLALTWPVGQHDDCFYAESKLYCLPGDLQTLDGRSLIVTDQKTGKTMDRRGVLYGRMVEVIHRLDINRPEIGKGKDAETGVFETKFDSKLTDYSMWDCYKTGVGSPAISCKLTKTLSQTHPKFQEYVAQQLALAKADEFLRGLKQDDLIKACGQPVRADKNSISISYFYTTAPGLPLKIEFDTLGTPSSPRLLHVSTEEEIPKDAFHQIMWTTYSSWLSKDLRVLMQEFPCLGAKVK
jgi:hypothetical protein